MPISFADHPERDGPPLFSQDGLPSALYVSLRVAGFKMFHMVGRIGRNGSMSSVMNGLQVLDDDQVAAAATHASRVLQAFISCARGGAKPAASLLEEAKRARGAPISVVDALKTPAEDGNP